MYMNIINDVSCLVDGKIIILAEHQSTINENMPSANTVLPCTVFAYEFLLTQKHRCCMEPPPSMAVLKWLLQIDEVDTRHKQKTPAGTTKNVRPVHSLSASSHCELDSAWNHCHPWQFWSVEDCFLWSNTVDTRIFVKEPETTVLKLSDAFITKSDSAPLELEVKVYNRPVR